MARKLLTDEIIIQALITEGSIQGAAQNLGVAVTTLYKRMKKDDFREMYSQARADIIRTATAKLQGHLCDAIDTLKSIMDDQSAPKQTRANCAVSILQYGAKFTEATDILERLEAIESAQAERKQTEEAERGL